MAISKKDVLTTAHLARIALDDKEVDALATQLGAILEHFEKLSILDTTHVEPMTHALDMRCPLRSDTEEAPLPHERALAAAPHREGDFFAVPKIIERGEDA